MIQLHDKHFVPFINAQDIAVVLQRIAGTIMDDLNGEIPVFVGVLNGAFMFFSDLLKYYTAPCEVNFLRLSSYEGTASTGTVNQVMGLNQSLKGRTVVIVEDIVDTGNTIEKLKDIFEAQKVKQLKIATLFFKPQAYTKTISIDYTGFEIPNKFIVGYGLDYDGLGRNLPEVYQLHS
ncbi:hypoxanthine phosphoribosyltransferase [Flavobacterium rhizosphaerae]|uniref:Hypoxanthine phosphoribosyltransferase n=1 Tax=Flavobacterium rhizosphaerae TaxID=3163298 RepID=A0ABW8YY59_9FLAO